MNPQQRRKNQKAAKRKDLSNAFMEAFKSMERDVRIKPPSKYDMFTGKKK